MNAITPQRINMSNKYISIMKHRQQRRRTRILTRRTRTHRRSMRRGGTSTRKSRTPGGSNLAVGKIFSISCGHCKNMAQDWEKLKLMHPNLITTETDIEASEIDTKLPALKDKYNIDFEFEGYPTIYKIIKSQNGVNTVVLYKGPRTTQAMHNWILGK